MFDLLFIISIVGSAVQAVKEICAPTIPAENWGNKELYHQDIVDGVPIEQRLKNAENGKYKMTAPYPEPYRDAKYGNIIIQNNKLYDEDVDNYGVYQARKWAMQGKYNLSPEEYAKEIERIKLKFGWD